MIRRICIATTIAVFVAGLTLTAQDLAPLDALPVLDGDVVTVTPELTPLEAARVDISLMNEMIVRLKIEKAALEKEIDILRLSLDRQQRTPPPRDGFLWDWTIDQQTGRPKGYVKTPDTKTPETSK